MFSTESSVHLADKWHRNVNCASSCGDVCFLDLIEMEHDIHTSSHVPLNSYEANR